MKAFHGDPAIKEALLDQLRAHAAADEIENGGFWMDGCTEHSRDHNEYETKYGIPAQLAYLVGVIFEVLPPRLANTWRIQFIEAIPVGADLSRVQWQFLAWLLSPETLPSGQQEGVRDAIARVRALCADAARGQMEPHHVWGEAALVAKAANAAAVVEKEKAVADAWLLGAAAVAWRAAVAVGAAWAAAAATLAASAPWEAPWAVTKAANAAAEAAAAANAAAAARVRAQARETAKDPLASWADWAAAKAAAYEDQALKLIELLEVAE